MAQVCHCACKAGLHIHKHTQAHTHTTRAHTHTHTYSHANIYTHIHAEDEAGEAEATEVGIVLPALIPKLVHHACKLPVPVSLLRVERSSNQAPLSFALDDMLDALKRADSMKHHIHIRRSTLLNLQIVSIMPIGCALIVHNLSTFIILHVHALPNAHLVFEGQYLDFQMLKRFYTITHIRTLSHIRTHIHTHTSTHTCKHTSARAVHLLYAQEEEEDDPYQLPISHEVTLGSGHNKAVTCLDIDHSGSRLLTGKVMYRVSMCTRACV